MCSDTAPCGVKRSTCSYVTPGKIDCAAFAAGAASTAMAAAVASIRGTTARVRVAEYDPRAMLVVLAPPVPILEYHVIATPPATAPYPQLYVRIPQFAAQVRWLASHGYQAVTMDQVDAAWSGRKPLPRRPVVFT